MTSGQPPEVAVIGGGFSGLMTALHLLDTPARPHVRLIESGPEVGRGLAYGHRCAEHRLNVRAVNMSAWPDQPHHFADWLAAAGDGETVFAGRATYGAYLQTLLAARLAADGGERLSLERARVVDLAQAGAGWTLTLDDGRAMVADAVVLAVGNPPPSPLPEIASGVAAAKGYVGDPWSAQLDEVPESGCVVLLGTGLTTVDVGLRLARRRPALTLLALSRRGLAPRRHPERREPHPDWAPPAGATARDVLREIRTRSQGRDWRAVVDGLRPHLQALWRSWDAAERRRFLRHLRPWWDVHRHRLALEVAGAVDDLVAGGALAFAAGRIEAITQTGAGLEVAWRPRGARTTRRTPATAVVNCTGPAPDLARADDPLLASLAAAGLVRADACRLGLDVDAKGRLLRADGRVNATLFAVGPPTRGAFWEITSVPDIRGQAQRCAAFVAAALAERAAGCQISPASGLEGSA